MPGVIERKFPWLIQPQYPVGIDWTNPLSNGLQDAHVLANGLGFNAVKNTFLSSNGTRNFEPRGAIITTDATAYAIPGGYSAFPISILVGMIRLGAPTSGNHALWLSKDQAPSGGLYFRYQDAGTLALIKSQVALIGSAAFTIKSGGSLMGAAVDATSYAVYGDGALLTSGTHAQAPLFGTPQLGSEGDNSSWDHPNGVFYFQATWNRLLSAAEFKGLSANPWQIFQPIKRRILVPSADLPTVLAPSGSGQTLRMVNAHRPQSINTSRPRQGNTSRPRNLH